MSILDTAYPTYQPAMRVIEFMTFLGEGDTTSVITTTPHQYKVGLIVRFIIPPVYGFQGLNQKIAPIIAIDDENIFIVGINSVYEKWDVHAVSNQYAQVIPVGEINEKLDSATYNVLPYGVN